MADEDPGSDLSQSALLQQAEVIVYLETEEVQPLPDPTTTLRKIREDLRSDHWVTQFQGLDAVRSLTLHHSTLLSPVVHKIAPLVATCAESLRSSVCKNALLCAFDLVTTLTTDLEPSVPHLLASLLKRSADTSNIFISASANSALVQLIESCPGPKLMQTLAAQAKTKTLRCVPLLQRA